MCNFLMRNNDSNVIGQDTADHRSFSLVDFGSSNSPAGGKCEICHPLRAPPMILSALYQWMMPATEGVHADGLT
jgi:hypothetical protein